MPLVLPLGPGKFYGTSLPRPRFYTDVKLNDERVDPPVPVLDPLLSWANEAHWSMGGLSFKRLRLQGRVEGNINKLRSEREKLAKKKKIADSPNRSDPYEAKNKRADSASPPSAPMATKKRRFVALIDEDEDVDEAKSEVVKNRGDRRRRLVKKLNDDFDKVASENDKVSGGSPLKDLSDDGSKTVSSRTRRLLENDATKPAMQVVQEVNKLSSKGKMLKEKTKEANGYSRSTGVVRTSPRLAKRG